MPRTTSREIYRSVWIDAPIIIFEFPLSIFRGTRARISSHVPPIKRKKANLEWRFADYKLSRIFSVENFRIVARYSGSVSLATAESTFGKRISPGLSGIFVQALTPVFSGQARPGSSMLNKYVH